jgi:hypothetical protein
MSELLAERELTGMWEYDAQLCASDGTLRRIVLRLSWADYNLWSPDGTVPPGTVAEAVLHFIAQHEAAFAGMERIDASAARRRVPGADTTIDALIRT